jgi:hypothetical protein
MRCEMGWDRVGVATSRRRLDFFYVAGIISRDTFMREKLLMMMMIMMVEYGV